MGYNTDYEGLKRYLDGRPENIVILSFDELKRIAVEIAHSYFDKRYIHLEYNPFNRKVAEMGYRLSADYDSETASFMRIGERVDGTVDGGDASGKMIIDENGRRQFAEKINSRENRDLFGGKHIACEKDIKSAIEYIYKKGVPFSRDSQTRPSYKDEGMDDVFDKLASEIHKYFTTSAAPNTQDTFDDFHDKLCAQFIGEMTPICIRTGHQPPTYGNAQKIVNITFKYLACYSDYDQYADLFSYCHIPIDSIIMTAMKRIYGLPSINKASISKSTEDNTFHYSAQFRGKPWSKLEDRQDYKDLVREYRSAMDAENSPLKIGTHPWLEFDFYCWKLTPVNRGRSYGYDVTPFEDTVFAERITLSGA